MDIVGPELGLGSVCEPVLRALPDWFGIEESLVQYVRDTDTLPTFRAMHQDQTAGFLAIRRHFPESSEVHVIGVRPEYHGQGVGTALVERAADWLRADGCQVLQVKTLSDRHSSTHYARTRQFYRSVGFVPLEVFPTLWTEYHPCLVMVRFLGT